MAIEKTYARRDVLRNGGCATPSARNKRPAATSSSQADKLSSGRGMHPRALMSRTSFPATLIALCFALIFIGGCHKGSASSITINLDPSATQQLDSGHSQTFTATLGGDTQNKGVKWTLTLNSNVCSSGTGAGCGTLTNPTTTSVTYTAPPVSAQENFTLTATAIADPVVTATVTITVEIAPQITTKNIPTSAMNGVPYTAAIAAIDGVPPLTFSISSGALPPGLQLNPNSGAIVGTPTAPSTPGAPSQLYNFSVQVTDFNGAQAVTPLALTITVAAPPVLSATGALPEGFLGGVYAGSIAATGGVSPLTFGVTSGVLPPGLSLSTNGGQISGVPVTAQGATYPKTYPFTVLVTDSAVPTHQTYSVSTSIIVTTPSQLQITTSSLPNGVSGTGYGALLQAKGGLPPYTWSLASGQLPAGLTLSTNTNDNTGKISGNPILAGTTTFTVQVTDSGVAPETQSETAQYTITISSGADSNSLVSGPYSFLFQGFDERGSMSVAGTFTADGNGNITSGFETSNRANASDGTTGIAQNSSLTGSYSIGLTGADGRGTLHLIATPNPAIQAPLDSDFQLVLRSDGTLQMIENDDTNTNTDILQTHGSGVIKPILQGGLAGGAFNGNYAFELSGQDYSANRMAIGGVFHADGVSMLTPVTGDINDAGVFSQLESPSGQFSYSSNSLSGASTLLYSLTGKSQTQLQFAFYFVSASDLYFVETDNPTSTDQFPRLSGEAVLQQTGVAFSSSSLSGESVVTGTGENGKLASVMAGLLTAPACDGVSTGIGLSYDQNAGGTVSSVTGVGTSTCNVASNGRVRFSTLDPRVTTAYLTGAGQGFLLGADPAVTTGLLELQTPATYTEALVAGSYALSGAPPGDPLVSSVVGQLTTPSLGSLQGVLDEVDAPGKPATLDDTSFGLTISSLASNGRGLMTQGGSQKFPANLVFYMLSPSQIRMISLDSNPNNGHPDVMSLNH
jgi:hypothetical protein